MTSNSFESKYLFLNFCIVYLISTSYNTYLLQKEINKEAIKNSFLLGTIFNRKDSVSGTVKYIEELLEIIFHIYFSYDQCLI